MLFYCNFFTGLFLILFFEHTLAPNRPFEQQIIEKDVADKNILLSWPTVLPENARLNSLTIFIKINQIDRPLALISPDSSVTTINIGQMPEEYRGRISTNPKGIILNKIDFEIDNGRIFYAILMYTLRGTLHEKRLPEIRLVVRYPIEFFDFPNKTYILENVEGSLVCIVRSYPAPKEVRWNVGGAAFTHYMDYPTLSQENKLKYGISLNSKLIYKIVVLRYSGVLRGMEANISCDAISDMMVKKSIFTSLDIQYAPDAPTSVETDEITDNEAMVRWKGPSPGTGNPQKILFYKVELMRHVPKASNSVKSGQIFRENERSTLEGDRQSLGEDGLTWKPYNFSQEQATLYNLEPNSQYFVRVKAFNGATYSTPSTETTFKTKFSQYATPRKWSITQPILIAIISASALFSLIIMFLMISCFIRIRKKRQRKWAVFNSNHHLFKSELQSAMKERKNKLEDDSIDYEFDKGFGNLPPPTLDAKDFQGVRNSGFPDLHGDSISMKGARNSNGNDVDSYCSYKIDSDAQTQISSKYITPAMASQSNERKNTVSSRPTRSISQASIYSNNTAYV